MVSVEDLQKVKLKSAEEGTRKDRSSPNLYLAQETTLATLQKRREYFFDTGIDRWYESLKDKTFHTSFLEITPNEARAIVSYWQQNFRDRSSHDPEVHESQVNIPDSLKLLEGRLDNVITGNGAFVKLSTRSPKDSEVAFSKAHRAYELKKAEDMSANDRLVLLGETVIESLKVSCGADTLKLFLSSNRVGEDLEYALEPGDDGFSGRISLVIREWIDIPLWAEFRGFVWKGALTAIGQYNFPVCFPKLVEQADAIKNDLKRFFDDVKGEIPLDHYIIDFAWTKNKIYLVEVNPFDGELVFPASTGLWSWEKDREQMENGPLELRIRNTEQPLDSLKGTLDPKWRAIIF